MHVHKVLSQISLCSQHWLIWEDTTLECNFAFRGILCKTNIQFWWKVSSLINLVWYFAKMHYTLGLPRTRLIV